MNSQSHFKWMFQANAPDFNWNIVQTLVPRKCNKFKPYWTLLFFTKYRPRLLACLVQFWWTGEPSKTNLKQLGSTNLDKRRVFISETPIFVTILNTTYFNLRVLNKSFYFRKRVDNAIFRRPHITWHHKKIYRRISKRMGKILCFVIRTLTCFIIRGMERGWEFPRFALDKRVIIKWNTGKS